MASGSKRIIISAVILDQTRKSWKMDCEGDVVWVPKSEGKYSVINKELSIPIWLAKTLFPGETF